jgi:hypothetical protein
LLYPFYSIIYIEGGWPRLKAGFWRVYRPNHLLEYEGNYEKGQRIGLFRFYDEKGRLLKTVNYGPYINYELFVALIVIPIIAGLFYRRKINRLRNSDVHVNLG